MKYGTVWELAQAFYVGGGHRPNQLWLHPSMTSYIYHSFKDPDFANHLIMPKGMENYSIATEFGSLELMIDDRVMPGVLYVDRDGEYTHKTPRTNYHSMAETWRNMAKEFAD